MWWVCGCAAGSVANSVIKENLENVKAKQVYKTMMKKVTSDQLILNNSSYMYIYKLHVYNMDEKKKKYIQIWQGLTNFPLLYCMAVTSPHVQHATVFVWKVVEKINYQIWNVKAENWRLGTFKR